MLAAQAGGSNTHVKSQVWKYTPVVSHTAGEADIDRRIPGVSRPASLTELVSSRFSEILSQRHSVSTAGLHTYTHT